MPHPARIRPIAEQARSTLTGNEAVSVFAFDEAVAEDLAELFRALSDPSRVRILSQLLQQEQNVNALAAAVGISESAVSHHLRGLRQMRIVRARRKGREVFYSIDDDHVAILLRQGLDHVSHG